MGNTPEGSVILSSYDAESLASALLKKLESGERVTSGILLDVNRAAERLLHIDSAAAYEEMVEKGYPQFTQWLQIFGSKFSAGKPTTFSLGGREVIGIYSDNQCIGNVISHQGCDFYRQDEFREAVRRLLSKKDIQTD